MSESPITMHRTAYEQRILAVLKAVACSSSTIDLGDLGWAINYQRTTRPLTDVLATLRPLMEDGGWPPLTCLVRAGQQPAVEADRALPAEQRMTARQCYAWAQGLSAERQQMRGQWAEAVLRGDSA